MKSKKMVGLVMAVMVAAASLLGCSSGGNSSGEGNETGKGDSSAEAGTQAKEVVEFWMLPLVDEAEIQKMVDEFNDENPDIEVKMSMLDWASGREQIKQAVAAGNGPDVFYLGAGLDVAYIEANLLLPLEEAGFSASDIDKYGELIEASKVEDQCLAAPIAYENYILYYRTDILETYGFQEPPKNWDEMKSMAKTITEGSGGDVMGLQFKGADDHLNSMHLTWSTLLAQAGGQMMDLDKMESVENSPEAVEALTYMKSFYDEGISQLGTSAANGLREGKVAMYAFTTGPLTSEGYLTNEEMNGKWGIAALPEGPKSAGGYLGGHALCISSGTKVAEKAGRFIKEFTSPRNCVKWMEGFYGVHPYNLDKLTTEEREGIEAVIAKEPELWEPILKSTELSSPDLMVQTRYGYTARWDGQKRLIMAVLTGEMTIDEALTQLDIEINQALI